jgi:hypothetical protein
MNVRTTFAAALEPLLRVIGATAIDVADATDSDVVLEWAGRPVVAIHLDFAETTAAQVRGVEAEFGAPLSDLTREQKQIAVRILDERGAFALRKAIEDVADAMGVSRITIYNYLNAIREPE